MRRNLSGRKVVITGAARGIGEKVARIAAARGARVALIGLEPNRLQALADDLEYRWQHAALAPRFARLTGLATVTLVLLTGLCPIK